MLLAISMKSNPRPAGLSAQKDNTTSESINLGIAKRGFRKKNGPTKEEMLNLLLLPIVHLYETCAHKISSVEAVVAVAILSCLQKTSIDDVCSYVVENLSARTVRFYLSCLHLDKVEKGVNGLLQKEVVPRIQRKWVKLVADLVLIPYYGDEYEDENEIRGGKAKEGTSHFHAYLTVYAVVRNHRYTIALRYVRKKEAVDEIFSETMNEILALDLNIRRVYLDKEFCSVRVINYLQEKHLSAVIAVPARGDKIKGLKCRSKGSRCLQWSMRNKYDEQAYFLLQCRQKYMKGSKVLGGGATWFFYATISVCRNPKRTSEEYRRRFGIESSYRMMDKSRGRTSSQNPALRLFYVLIAFMVVNLKVIFEMLLARTKRISRVKSTSIMRQARLQRIFRSMLENHLQNLAHRRQLADLEEC